MGLQRVHALISLVYRSQSSPFDAVTTLYVALGCVIVRRRLLLQVLVVPTAWRN